MVSGSRWSTERRKNEFASEIKRFPQDKTEYQSEMTHHQRNRLINNCVVEVVLGFQLPRTWIPELRCGSDKLVDASTSS